MSSDRIALAERIAERMKGEDPHEGSRPMLGLTVGEWAVVEAALRADHDAGGAVAMRERCAAICEQQAHGFASAVGSSAEQTGDAQAASALKSAAVLIRALPLASQEGSGC